MRAARYAIAAVCGAVGLAAAGGAHRVSAQVEIPPARAPCSVLSGQPCHPAFCDVFHYGPCFPQYLPPIGQDLRLTIVSTDDGEHAEKPAGDAGAGGDDHALDTIRDMFSTLRGCWVPPPKAEARRGMEYTVRFAFKRDGSVIAPARVTYVSHDAPAATRSAYRDAVDAALKRRTPLHFSKGMGGAVAGRPIAIRFVDDRTIADAGK
jgi:hypothetical protein